MSEAAPLSAAVTPVATGDPSDAFEKFYDAKVQPFADCCREIGHDVEPMGYLIENVFRQMQWIVDTATVHQKPSPEKLLDMIKPIGFAVENASGNRNKEGLAYNHQSALSFMVPAALWMIVEENVATGPYVREQIKEGSKYVDKVRRKPNLKDKTSPELHEKWLVLLVDLFESLAVFVETYYPHGLTWTADGKVLAEEFKSDGFVQPGKVSTLKGVWTFENYERGRNISPPTEDLVMKHGVLILNSKTSEFKVGAKIKHVTLEHCTKCKIYVTDLVSSLNVMNSSHIELFVNGAVPTISIERSQSVQIWLTKEAIAANPDILTWNNDQVNLMCPKTENGNNFSEVPIPQQFVSKLQGTYGTFKVFTEPVKHF
eukprot:TRINITY_DN29099_c0_g1_i1.p1 TRINITY_DN29099_c0_g1~~TRINITY_DN29099_c0_g1_i1.p1  ORF type:complete len:372 (+),score=101.15 TRINITY_DN29099_c0_g1_i1:665-1780(+)